MKHLATLSAIVTGCALFANAQAQDTSATLQKIRDTGVISLGIRESSVPFSYYDNQQHTIGYSQDIALRIVDEVKKELKLSKLTVKETPITSQNRIPLVQNGTIDIECGSTTHTRERDNQVAFTNSFFQYGVRLITRKDSGVKDFSDLAGKTVVTTAGTSEDRLLREMNNAKKMNMQLIFAKDHAESFLVLKTGRAAAYVNDEPLLYGARAREQDPQDYVITGTPPMSEAYGCMVRKDDPVFKKLADRVIADMQTSGETARLYTKWFTQPIPPKGFNLDYPLSAENKALFAHPNDQALD
ncbi:glutamate and aspartate transporter subunit; periplasmic-binding component of ABC superfamily [Paraburkholderia ribeironis]|uniref:Glutamate and aspartate transporter subunit periplasmic-binding component of ABC superfamily n=1 Tax=Paraburkholderia ribeironis TaxID=1247936 RepID=A0A1N7RLZ3_9BURK|nr:transporter substrate-binding domain-containing protein [Paraburkholderia ribeironis]SIT36127.1 glutamate and aspartate transporter subunit; periplasmic-binding component of ABC superfamily [Paraburkholderia ribeironis]